MNLILGAGLAGLSCSYYLGHQNCLVLERELYSGGHVQSEFREGFTWDQGPHVSFTRNEFVRRVLSESVGGEFLEYPVRVGNYFHGEWIDHPAQCALHQIPEPLRTKCLESFLSTREDSNSSQMAPTNYREWLEQAFGPVFAQEFPEKYTLKYWTVPSEKLTTSWLGNRVYRPLVEDVRAGYLGQLVDSKHYILNVRYPRKGGYSAYTNLFRQDCRIEYGADVCRIDLQNKVVHSADGRSFTYVRLINTMPLPLFIHLCQNVPEEVREAAQALICTQLLLVSSRAHHTTRRPENWIYVYDEDKLSTRIHCTELLSPENAPTGWTGVQTEVYFSRQRPLSVAPEMVSRRVSLELVEMGLIDAGSIARPGEYGRSIKYVPWANPIFSAETEAAKTRIWEWLEQFRFFREADDLHPLTTWSETTPAPSAGGADVFMAGRFGQWKYFWSDDCILRGRHLGEAIGK